MTTMGGLREFLTTADLEREMTDLFNRTEPVSANTVAVSWNTAAQMYGGVIDAERRRGWARCAVGVAAGLFAGLILLRR